MSYVGEIGKRLTVEVTFKKSSEYIDYKFSYYGTTHYIHVFEDSDGNTLVWKTTNTVEEIVNGAYEFIPTGSTVEMTCTVKEHGRYKDTDQTVVTRCKFKTISRAKTHQEIQAERLDTQLHSLGENDFIWEMPYRQYKAHYSDCETVIGSYDDHTDSRGNVHGDPTIKVIIRDGRLKKSGVRGEHYSGYEFTADDGTKVVRRAISEETALKRLKKEYPGIANWELTRIYNYKNGHRIR